MSLKSISKKAKALWIIRNLIVLAVLTAGQLIALLLCADEEAFPLVAAIVGVSWLILAALLLIWPSLTYKNYAYGYDDKRLVLRYGVIFKHQITAPLCQVQDLHFFEGPIMRLFGLGKIIFSTGGSNFDLAGLDKTEALAIIEEIEARLRARVEENTDEEI